ncbi:MAG: hypothetical protein GY927_01275 [bacterium]|nr:hypothetical protein [bacterium]
MKMFDRSVFSALSLFLVVAGLSLNPGNAALAVEQDHGNPGQFIDNIRKGISGLSKYFWSPKAQIPGESTAQPAKGDKVLAPVIKPQQADEKKATKVHDAKPAISAPAAIVKKPVSKPAQMIQPDNKMARVPASPKTTFESKAATDHKKRMAVTKKAGSVVTKTTPTAKPVLKVAKPALAVKPALKVKSAQKASRSSSKALAQSSSQSPAIVSMQNKIAKQSLTRKTTSLVTPRAILKNKPAPVTPAKRVSPMAIAGNTAKDKKSFGAMKQKTAQKPFVKKSAAVSVPSNSASVQTKMPSIKKTVVATVVAANTKTPKQQLVPNDKGTYIWVPNIGSQLSQRFGLTGIPAKELHANGDLNRTDGRWAFAPKKNGMLPSIYGLSAEIHAAGETGVWVGGGYNWVYVFDKKRSYGSIVGGTRAKEKVAAKLAKPVESLKSGAFKSGFAGVQKPAIANKADKSAKTKKIAKPIDAQINKTTKKAARPQKGIEVKKATKKLTQAPRQHTVIKPLGKSAGRAKAGSKAVSNGKWSRVNNRWVFVPHSQPGRMAGANMVPKTSAATGLAEGPDASEVKTTKNQKIWVRKNNKWVYVFAFPAAKTQQMQQAKREQGTLIARRNSAQQNTIGQNATKQRLVTRAGKKPLGEFMFFVPGQTPGTGSWFIAPLQMLEKAKKIKLPSFAGNR